AARLSGNAHRPRARGVHDGHVPGHRVDAMDHGRGGLAGARPARRRFHRGAAGPGCSRLRIASGTRAGQRAGVTRVAAAPSAWRVVVAGIVSLAVAMGIGRFAFTPLLPMMLADGVVDLPTASWLASANYLGYLLG